MNYEKNNSSIYEDANSNIDPKYFIVSKPDNNYEENIENEINDNINSNKLKNKIQMNQYPNTTNRTGKDFFYQEPIAFIDKERVNNGCCKDDECIIF